MRTKTMRLAFCGVIAALSVVVLFLTGIVPGTRDKLICPDRME